jgi:hypothetical protein
MGIGEKGLTIPFVFPVDNASGKDPYIKLFKIVQHLSQSF